MKTFHLAFFDVDSTLAAIEGIDVLGVGRPEIARLTECAMNGEIRMDEVYAKRLEIIRPTREQINELGRRYIESMIPDAPAVMNELRGAGMEIYLVSAGIEQAILPLAKVLGISERAIRAVRLEFDEKGRYRDFDHRSVLTRNGGKETVVMNIRARSKGKAFFVGDGITDLEAKGAVDLFIGFGGVRARERVKSESDAFIEERSLRRVPEIVRQAESRHD